MSMLVGTKPGRRVCQGPRGRKLDGCGRPRTFCLSECQCRFPERVDYGVLTNPRVVLVIVFPYLYPQPRHPLLERIGNDGRKDLAPGHRPSRLRRRAPKTKDIRDNHPPRILFQPRQRKIRRIVAFSQPDNGRMRPRVNLIHQLNLHHLFRVVGLVDAYRVHPHGNRAVAPSKGQESIAAVGGNVDGARVVVA